MGTVLRWIEANPLHAAVVAGLADDPHAIPPPRTDKLREARRPGYLTLLGAGRGLLGGTLSTRGLGGLLGGALDRRGPGGPLGEGFHARSQRLGHGCEVPI